MALKIRRLLLPLGLGLGLFALWLSLPTAVKAQATYYLYPARITDTLPFAYNQAGHVIIVNNNSLQAYGTCQHTWPSWDSCGAYVALQRGGLDIAGLVFDIQQMSGDRPDKNALNTTGIAIGTAALLDLNIADSIPNGTIPPTLRWCATEIAALDLVDFDCDEIYDDEWNSAATGSISNRNATSISGQNDTNGSSYNIEVEFWWILVSCPPGWSPDGIYCVEDDDPPPPPDDSGVDPSATCTFSQVVTSSSGTSSTVSVTVPANLMPNYSFESSDGDSPSNWNLWDDPNDSQWYPLAAGPGWGYEPRSGDRHLAGYNYGGGSTSVQVWEIGTTVYLESAGDYRAGHFAKCVGENCNSQVRLYHNGIFIAGTFPISTTYNVFSDVIPLAAGEHVFYLTFTTHGWVPRTIFADDVFLWPVDESGAILCDEDYYDVPDPDLPTCVRDEYGNCIPAPTGGSGATCYLCNTPAGESFFSVPHWIAWLGCLIRNLFSCSLRIWLMNITNAIQGLIKWFSTYALWIPANGQVAVDWIAGQVVPALQNVASFELLDYVSAGIDWIAATVQGAANWIASQVVPALTPLVIVYDTGTNLWDAVIAFLILVVTAFKTIITALLSLIGIVLQFIAGVTTGLQAEPATIDLPVAGRYAESGLAATGGNADKIVWLFMVGVTLIDQDVTPRFSPVLIGIVAAGAVGLIWWTFEHWRDSVSF